MFRPLNMPVLSKNGGVLRLCYGLYILFVALNKVYYEYLLQFIWAYKLPKTKLFDTSFAFNNKYLMYNFFCFLPFFFIFFMWAYNSNACVKRSRATISEKEMVAVFFRIKKFESDLRGRKFHLMTDHKVLAEIRNKPFFNNNRINR
jgi:hypothetical protein